MKIYIGHSRKFNYKTELYQPIRQSRLNNEHKIIFPHESDEYIETKNIIKKSDIMVAEVSFPSAGLGTELTWANSLGCPILCIYRKGAKPPGSLKVACDTFIEYTDLDDMVNKIESALKTRG